MNRFSRAFLLLALFLTPLAAQEEPPPLLERIDREFQTVYERVAPAVVVVEIRKKAFSGEAGRLFGFDFFVPPQEEQFEIPSPDSRRMPPPQRPPAPVSEGSGFIARADGYIYTNDHVIADAEEIRVTLHDGRNFPAEVVGRDERADIALLKIEAENMPAAELADSDKVRVGQLVFAIGTPYNLDYSFTTGVVSAKDRSGLQETLPKIRYESYIQTDAAINPGNSGGPLFDVRGRVIGMNTLINGINRGLGFAIPANMLREVGEQLIATGRVVRPWLGVRIETLRDVLMENPAMRPHFDGIQDGVVVDTIQPGTPAHESDLQPADVITAVDGAEVQSARELQRLILSKEVGEELDLSVWRNGESVTVPIKTGELPDEPEVAVLDDEEAQPAAPAEESPPVLEGLQVQELTRELAERLSLDVHQGVLVTSVAQNSPAEAAGLAKNDVITEVNQQKVQTVEAFQEQVQKSDSGKGILLFLDRHGEKTYKILKS